MASDKTIYKGILISGIILLFLIGCQTKSPERPNIILISVDTLRPDHLGCYGYNQKVSPNLDQFAKDSLLFENCFSHAPNTGPSCTSFLSGFLPHETKVMVNNAKVHPDVPMIAEILQNNGYKTYAVVSNYVLHENKGYEQGFDIYDAQMEDQELNRKNVFERIAEKTTQAAIDIIKQHSDGQFFLWVHYQDPHGPYTPKAPYDQMFVAHHKIPIHLKFDHSVRGLGGIPSYQRLENNSDFHYYVAQYDGEIGYFDEYFARLITSLKTNHFYDNSLIIFTADHGEAMGEHNYYFAHGHAVTNDLIHVPLMIKYQKKGRVRDFVQHLDIVPTILKGANIEPSLSYRGRDLLAKQLKPTIIYSEGRSVTISVISDELKFLIHGKNAYLFDIDKDFYENNNLITRSAYKNQVMVMQRQMAKIHDEDLLSASIVEERPTLTEQERERLRSLGYVEVGETDDE